VPTKVVARAGYLSESRMIVRKPASTYVRSLERAGTPMLYNETSLTTLQPIPNGQWFVNYRPHLDIIDLKRTITGQSITGGYAGVNSAVVEAYESVLTYANQGQTACELELYDVYARRDINTVTTIVVNGVSYNVAGNPVSFCAAGVAAALGNPSPPTLASYASAVGESPFDSSFFKDYFRVAKRTIIQLAPGTQHRHVVSSKANYHVKEDITSNTVLQGVANVTSYTLAVWRPYIGSIQLGAAAAGGNMAAYVVDQQTKRIKWTFVLNQQEQLVRLIQTSNIAGAKTNTIIPQTGGQVTGALDANGTIM